MASKNTIMAVALITCMIRKLRLFGLFGSFFLKKYMTYEIKKTALIATVQGGVFIF